MICEECGKVLTNEEDCYGHDCEADRKEFLKELRIDTEKWFNKIEKEIK